jgi:hypothetical protein
MAYKIFDNTNFALNDERENGFIVYFKEGSDFHNYQFENLDGFSIVEACWNNEEGSTLSRTWFDSDTINHK